MDIGSGAGYPASSLSNFAPHAFEIDGIKCASMEGFLQSLKFSSPEMAKHVCTLVGRAAKFKGKNKRWWSTQTLYWKGEPFHRESPFYQALLTQAYDALNENTKFRAALAATRNATLTHSMGKNKESETVLTEREFCRQLTRLRQKNLVS
ncbi:hypothetical protein [Cronobacter phage vB_Cdu_VP8]|nr:hypothetical protein [Cronobacter phage vB_Cdu_VP8]